MKYFFITILLIIQFFPACRFDEPFDKDGPGDSSYDTGNPVDNGNPQGTGDSYPNNGCLLPSMDLTADYDARSFMSDIKIGANGYQGANYVTMTRTSLYQDTRSLSLSLSGTMDYYMIILIKSPYVEEKILDTGGGNSSFLVTAIAYCGLMECVDGYFLAGLFNGANYGSGKLTLAYDSLSRLQIDLDLTLYNRDYSDKSMLLSGRMTEILDCPSE